MKLNKLSKFIQSRRMLIVLCLFAVVASFILIMRSAQQGARVAYARPVIDARQLEDGLGAVSLSDVESVASFIQRRSGTALSGAAKSRLSSLQSQVQSGTRRKLTVSDFSRILTEVLLEDVEALSDADIAYIANSMRTVPAWDAPNDVVIMLRETGGIILPPNEFAPYAKAFRDESTAEAIAWRNSSADRLQQEIKTRLQWYGEVLPSWQGALTSGTTPSQAILVAYSIVSDDPMVGSDADLRQTMQNVHNFLSQEYASKPSFAQLQAASQVALQTQPPYGTTGYLFSSPLNFFFDEATLLRLLQRIEEVTVL